MDSQLERARPHLNGYIMSEGNDSSEPDIYSESEGCPGGDSFAFGEDLELNHFDGLPFSSRYYKLIKERKTLPVWKVKREFEDALAKNQMVLVSGTAKTGRSTQVRMEVKYLVRGKFKCKFSTSLYLL